MRYILIALSLFVIGTIYTAVHAPRCTGISTRVGRGIMRDCSTYETHASVSDKQSTFGRAITK